MENFNKFKKKIIFEVLIKCFIIALSLGLIGFSVPYIYIKVNGILFNILYLVIGSGILFLLGFIISFVILKPNRIKIAKRIDKQLDLNQKVQTMVEYEKEDNFMIKLQREDTLNVLSNISIKSFGMKFSLVLFLIFGGACLACVTAFAIPSYEDAPIVQPEDPDYTVDDWTILAIKDIIVKVNESTASDSLKVKYVDLLNALIEELKENIDKESKLKEYVLKLIDDVLLELDRENSNNEIFMVLKESSNSLVCDLGVELNVLDVEDVTKLIENISILIGGESEAISLFQEDFTKLLKSSDLKTVYANDELYLALVKLGDDIYSVRDSNNIYSDVNNIVYSSRDGIVDIVKHQAENYRIAHYIEYELKDIFSLNEVVEDGSIDDEDEQNKNPYDDTNNDRDDQSQNNSGGLGTGDILFGSNDAFFDPEMGTVVYGDVITKYYGEILGKLNEGILPEELREYFELYYDVLLGDGNLDKE